MRRLALAVACLLVFAASANAAKPHWTPDKHFARTLRTLFEKANPSLAVTEDVCMAAALPKNTAATIGVPEEDCLVFSRQTSGAGVCFEIVWESGPLEYRLTCALARKAVRHDTVPGDVVRYRVGPAA